MVRLGGFEPPTSGATIQRSNQLSYNRIRGACAVWCVEIKSFGDLRKAKGCGFAPPGIAGASPQTKGPGLAARSRTHGNLRLRTGYIGLVAPTAFCIASRPGFSMSWATDCARDCMSFAWLVTISICLRT